MYAVIRTGGKQYRVAPGDILKIEKAVGDADGIVLRRIDERLPGVDPVARIGGPLDPGRPFTEEIAVLRDGVGHDDEFPHFFANQVQAGHPGHAPVEHGHLVLVEPEVGGRGLTVGMLYVDADNVAAVSMYRSMGFVDKHVDRAYVRQVD